ncbi:unnamed protein product, partial [Sphacelaria rigidula]
AIQKVQYIILQLSVHCDAVNYCLAIPYRESVVQTVVQTVRCPALSNSRPRPHCDDFSTSHRIRYHILVRDRNTARCSTACALRTLRIVPTIFFQPKVARVGNCTQGNVYPPSI